MVQPVSIDTAIQREMLQVALRNSARSIWLLMVAVLFVAWLGQHNARLGAALATLVIGSAVSAWRWWLLRRYGETSALAPAQIARVVRQLEANALLVGLMWAGATVFIYPTLHDATATVYIAVVVGSIAMAAFFMSMAGRSFLLLTTLQLGSLVGVSLHSEQPGSMALAVLAVVFGVTMLRVAREFRDTAARAMRHSLEADMANLSLLRAKEAAEAANLAKSQFLATMSHEIRTPMNGVLGALDLMRQTPLEPRQRRLLKTAAMSGESLMEILNDVLDHSKIEAGKLMLATTPMSLHSVARSAVAQLRANAESCGLGVTLQIADGVADGVVGDAPRLKQVLLNLVGNGVKFTEQGSVALRLSAACGADAQASPCRVRFEVEDTGIGIPASDLAQVFQPFHQVDSTHSRLRGGTGLGLAISQRIVQAMGGCIELNSRPGVGSVFAFEITFPRSRSVPLPAPDSSFGELDSSQPLSGLVLLVEDNPVNRMIGVEMLKSLGLKVLEAEDGLQGLAVLERERVDLVLMDIQMPVLDGYAATGQVRQREARLRLPRVPIVALTANAFDEDAALSVAAGMDAHLAKPYSRAQLRELLARWLL